MDCKRVCGEQANFPIDLMHLIPSYLTQFTNTVKLNW